MMSTTSQKDVAYSSGVETWERLIPQRSEWVLDKRFQLEWSVGNLLRP